MDFFQGIFRMLYNACIGGGIKVTISAEENNCILEGLETLFIRVKILQWNCSTEGFLL